MPVPVPKTPQDESAPDPPAALVQPTKRNCTSWAHQLKRASTPTPSSARKYATFLRVLAFLSNPAVVTKILNHLRLPGSAPPLAPARLPEDEFPSFRDTEFAGDDFDEPARKTPGLATTPRPGRGPP